MPGEPVSHLTPVELLQRLLRFRTENPPGGERACIEWIAGLLASAGLHVQVLASDPERPNLVARLPGAGVAPPLLLHGHVDVVPARDEGWRHPPFSGVVEAGEVWGRGALDMKGGVAMMLTAVLAAAAAQEARPAGDIILALLSDEEAGGALGAGFLVEQHAHLFSGVRHAIGEFGGFTVHLAGQRFYPIQVAEKQLCTVRVHVRGPSGHGALSIGRGTTARLADVLGRLERPLPLHVHPIVGRMLDDMAAALPLPAALAARALKRRGVSNVVAGRLGPYGALLRPMLRNTVNANVVRAGEQFNVVPAEATVLLDGRVLPHLGEAEFLQELAVRLPDGVETEVVRFEAGRSAPDLGLFDLLSEVLREGDPAAHPVPFVLPASTDGRHFGRLGIQHYGFLPMRLPADLPFGALVHGVDERIPVDALMFGVGAFTALLTRYQG